MKQINFRVKFAVLCTTLMVVGIFSYGHAAAQDVRANRGDNRDYQMGKSMEVFNNIFRDINLYYVDTVNSQAMLENAAQGMLQRLDPYTEYMPESRMADFEMMTTGKYGGIGSMIRQRGAWVEIGEPYLGSPADLAGLRAGERIVEIDGESMQNRDVAAVSGKLKGRPGSKLTLKMASVLDTTQVREVVVVRRNIDIPAVSWSGMVGDGIGYIRLETFTQNCADAVRVELENLIKQHGIRGLVLDLRGNGGGLVDQAVKICGFFVPRGTLITQIKGKVKQYDSEHRTVNNPVSTTLPLAVLVSGASASASEIVAGAMQDLDRGVVLGQRSFGKGLVQVTRPMGYNSFLKLTTARYYIPSGRSIQALNYSTRGVNGAVEHIPDSLISEYQTVAGRKVYDGAGINPDVPLQAEYLSKFAAILYGLGFIEDFANVYAARADSAGAITFSDNTGTINSVATGVIEKFEVSDSLYEEFVKFMADKEIDFTSATELKVKELREYAEREKYLDQISSELDVIYEKIKDDKSRDLRTFAPEIKKLLAEVIINRWFYAAGRIQYTVLSDKEIHKAVEVLQDSSLYTEILTTQDTAKK